MGQDYADKQGVCETPGCGKTFIKKGKATLCIDCRERLRLERHKNARSASRRRKAKKE